MSKTKRKKKRNLLILVDKVGEKKKFLASYLKKSLSRQTAVDLARFSDLIFETEDRNIKITVKNKNICEFDLIYFRRVGGTQSNFFSTAGTLAVCLDFLKIRYFDTTFGNIGPAGDKFTSLVRLLLAGLPVPPTFFCWRDKIASQIDNIVRKFGFPLVAKGLSSHRGRNVFLLKSKKDFEIFGKIKGEDQFLFQKFCPNQEEYRVLVLGDEAVVWEEKIRTDPDEFRSNIALGAQEKFLDIKKIPPKIKEIAVKSAKVANLQVAGIDILVETKTKKIWVLEVNRGPGFTYDSKTSPELKSLASFFKQELKKINER